MVVTKIVCSNTSPYANTPQTDWYIGRYVHRSIAATSNDGILVIDPSYQYRPDKLSNDLYGSPVYWWVFSVRNPSVIRDPIWDMTVGKTIYTPSVDAIRSLSG